MLDCAAVDIVGPDFGDSKKRQRLLDHQTPGVPLHAPDVVRNASAESTDGAIVRGRHDAAFDEIRHQRGGSKFHLRSIHDCPYP